MQFMDAGKVVEALMEVSQRIDALESENMALRAALKPFAPFADHANYFESDREEWPIAIGDLRAAAAALKETGNE